MGSFKEFYAEHKDRLFGYLMRMSGDYFLAGDLTQESFVTYMDHYGQENLSSSLLYKIARNALFDHKRKQGRMVELDGREEYASGDNENSAMVREEYRRVLAAMRKLAGDERETLALAAAGSLSYREIAAVLNISEANVKVKVHRARVNLKKILAQGER